MDAYCPRCETSTQDVTEAVLQKGECAVCGGQISLGAVTADGPVVGAVAMSFAAGSRVAVPLEAAFESTSLDLSGGGRGPAGLGDEVTQPRAKRPPPPPLDDEVTLNMSLSHGDMPDSGGGNGPPPPPPDALDDGAAAAPPAPPADAAGDLFASSDTPDDESWDAPAPDAWDGADTDSATPQGELPADLDPPEAEAPAAMAPPAEEPALRAEEPAPPAEELAPPAEAPADAPDVDPLAAAGLGPPPEMDAESTVLDVGFPAAPSVDASAAMAAADAALAAATGEPESEPAAESAPVEEPAAPVSADAGGPAVGAHLQLPSIDFSVPDMGMGGDAAVSPAADASAEAAGVPTAAATQPAAAAGGELPAHLQLPSFPDFELPPIPGAGGEAAAGDLAIQGVAGGSFEAMQEQSGEAAPSSAPGAAASGETADNWSVAGTPEGPPALPPPPPIPAKKAAPEPQAAAAESLPDLPAFGLPAFQGQAQKKANPTLLETSAALSIAQVDTKRSLFATLMIGLVVIVVLGLVGGGIYVGVNGLEETMAMINPPDEKTTAERRREKAADLFLEGLATYNKAAEAEAAKKTKDASKGFSKAAKQLSKAVKNDPKHGKAHRTLGIVLAKLSRQKEAVSHYRTYLVLEPKAEDASKVQKIVDDYEKAQKKKKK